MLKEEVIQRTSTKNQFIAAIVVNLLMVGLGVVNGWASPAITLLTSDDSPLPTGKITMEEAAWVASIMCIGGLIGNIIFGFITNAFGRKLPLMFICLPAIIGWLLILFAQNVYYLYVARFINGFVGGGLFCILPLYLNEIASDSVRGILGSSIVLCLNMGTLLAFVLGDYCDFETTPKIIIGSIILSFICLFYFPETPMFLLKQGKITETEESIRFYQNRRGKVNDHEYIQSEIEKLKKSIGGPMTENKSKSSFTWSDLASNPGRRALMIGIVLALINQFSGYFAMLNYTANIFKEAGSSLSPNTSAIVVGIILVLGSYVSIFLVERTGRKFLFAVSTIGTALGEIVLGTYVMLKGMGVDVEAHNWIPLASFSFVIFIAAWAIITLPFLVISEIMPEKIKDFGCASCVALLWSSAFVVVKLSPFLNETLGFHGTMFFFAGCCLSSAAFIITKMPETKGKSYDEVMVALSK